MRILIAALVTVALCDQACAIFSAHAIVTPKNVSEHKDYKVWLYCTKDDPSMVHVVLPFHEGDKKYWLVSSSRELQDKEVNFRNLIWLSYKAAPEYIRQIAPIAPIVDRSGKVPDGAFIRFKIRRDKLPVTYLYQDFDQPVDDGGWYRTYRLSAFPIGTGIDPIMRLEWDISRFKRMGDNAKHREAERELQQMLADDAFMANWGQRYLAEQDAADSGTTAPGSDPEGKEDLRPESEGSAQ